MTTPPFLIPVILYLSLLYVNLGLGWVLILGQVDLELLGLLPTCTCITASAAGGGGGYGGGPQGGLERGLGLGREATYLEKREERTGWSIVSDVVPGDAWRKRGRGLYDRGSRKDR